MSNVLPRAICFFHHDLWWNSRAPTIPIFCFQFWRECPWNLVIFSIAKPLLKSPHLFHLMTIYRTCVAPMYRQDRANLLVEMNWLDCDFHVLFCVDMNMWVTKGSCSNYFVLYHAWTRGCRSFRHAIQRKYVAYPSLQKMVTCCYHAM